MYKIWKASVTEYRVYNTVTKEMKVAENIILINCRLKVSLKRFEEARTTSFQNSENSKDYFAWIECDNVKIRKQHLLLNKVYYNPFKSKWFRNRNTLKRIVRAEKIIINGNILSYE